MKKYVTPSAYFELFVPNQYAQMCTPGVSEKDLKPQTESCYFYGKNGGTADFYNMASKTSCTWQNRNSGACSSLDATKSIITSYQSCDVKFDSTTSSLKVKYASLNGGAVQPVYVWDNRRDGTHKMPTSVFPENTTDSEGRPHYFNS